MLRFVVGTLAIISPRKVGLPLAVVVAASKGIAAALRSRRQRRVDPNASEPTQQRESSLQRVDVAWRDIHVTIESHSGPPRPILTAVSGSAKAGRLTAIMGPSGGGKTTLLNVLASQVSVNKRMDLRGSVLINGVPAESSNHRQAYIQQEDVFYSMLTASETLEMACQTCLPASVSEDSRAACISRLVATLGLAKVMDTRVGDKKVRGLSGGEKKRLSIGCELIGSPSLLFLDEPTTGLDAFAANRVVSTLKDLAAQGHTVVTSIHQPRSSIFAMFDDLILLAEGKVIYSGPADEAIDYFSRQAHSCPATYNPADFLADLISVDCSAPELENVSRARIDALSTAWHSASSASLKPDPPSLAAPPAAPEPAAPKGGWWRQLRLLALRSWRQVSRDRATIVARAMANISSALIFGAIFFRIKRSQSSIQDRLGLLQVAAINTAMGSIVKTLNVFPKERVIVGRERAKNSYGTATYLTAKLVAELPIGALFPILFGCITYPLCGLNPRPSRFLTYLGVLTLESFSSSALGLAVGAFAPSSEAASAIGPAVMVVFIVFGGYYVNQDNVPRLLRWLPSASLIKQGFQALCINEFDGLSFEPDAAGRGMTDGDQVLSWLSFDQSSVQQCLVLQTKILAFYYYATYCILQSRRKEFMRLAPPPASEPQVDK